MTPCYVFDIDGTLADCSHRLHHILKSPKDWDAFFAATADDAPHEHMIRLARDCHARAQIIYLTGRPEKTRIATREWLATVWLPKAPLYMRPNGDHRDDDILKVGMLATIRADGFEPIMMFEDRTRIVKAIRAAGVPCLQVAAGDF